MTDFTRIRDSIGQIYGLETVPGIMGPLEVMLRARLPSLPRPAAQGLSERDVILITYADQVRDADRPPLESLHECAGQFLEGLVNGIHILPFYPSSSDDGFSVIDYRSVDPAYGDWADIARLGRHFRLMFDAVVNHASAQGAWFKAFLRNEDPYKDYFVTVKGDADLSAVVRPRTPPLLTEFPTARGDRAVWTTFSADQADLNYGNPDVLLEMLDLLLSYVAHGATFIRLDAIAYLWKEVGTTCIHLPQVHAIVRLMRAILDQAAPHVMLLTETNVAHAENMGYLGDGSNEAHLVYNFALPPLILHAFCSGQAATLSDWAAGLVMPSEETAFFNVLATHDGIGLNGARGILTEAEVLHLARRIEASGGRISMRANPDGTSSPYEINANYYDALESSGPNTDTELGVARFLTAHAIMLAFKGIPGVYFHSMFGSRGWEEGVSRSGQARSVNREKLGRAALTDELANPRSLRSRIYGGMERLLRARQVCAAFAPRAEQCVLRVGSGIFAFTRGPDGDGGQVLCVHNVTAQEQSFRCGAWILGHGVHRQAEDLISSRRFKWESEANLSLGPYETIWLRIRKRENGPGN
ncbi:MAG: sugar phosphorylase [Chloroflexota bacterium]